MLAAWRKNAPNMPLSASRRAAAAQAVFTNTDCAIRQARCAKQRSLKETKESSLLSAWKTAKV